MSVAPIPSASLVRFTDRTELDRIYQHIHYRIDAAKKTMPGIRLEEESREKDKIVHKFQENIENDPGDAELVKKSIEAAWQALKELDWTLDKKITLAQLTVFYFRLLSKAGLSPEEVEAVEDPNAEPSQGNEFLPMGKQAYRILEATREKFEEAERKPQLEQAAMECFSELTRLKSSVLKESTLSDIQTLIKQVLKEVPEEQRTAMQAETESLVKAVNEMLRREDASYVLSPEKASQIIVEASKRLAELGAMIEGKSGKT